LADAYIAAALRTACGRRNGRLSGWHPVDLAARVLDAIVERTGIDPAAVDDVLLGCVGQVGEQSTNVARNAVLASKLPESVPAASIDRQCGSSQQALHFAAQAVMSGTMDCVIAGGVESMSRVPMGLASELPRRSGLGLPKSPGLAARYPGVEFSQFDGAESLARRHGLDRAALDAYALDSHRRAAEAARAGRFADEIVPVPARVAAAAEAAGGNAGDGGLLHEIDEGIRFDASAEAIATLKLLRPDGVLTAATSSQIADGASAVLVVSERALNTFGLRPMARVHHLSVLGHDPVVMLEAPIPATLRALRRVGLAIDDVDAFEINEAFASVPLAWLRATGADPARLNVHGGAIALGHPLGASGTKLMATLLNVLRQRGGRYGLQAMCEGGGMANVTIVERL